MITVICNESGIQFEAKTKRSTQHPAVAALKAEAAKRGTYAATMNAIADVRKAGDYKTVEQFIQIVTDQVNGVRKVAIESKVAAQIAQKEAEDKRKRQNALLRTNGYNWIQDEVTGYFGGVGDKPEYEWTLLDPDGHPITVAQALDEIARGRDIVRAEIGVGEVAK